MNAVARRVARACLAALACVAGPLSAASPEPVDPVARGRDLARQYCAACHLFPEPDLLDRRTWEQQTFRKIAPFLGVARVQTAGRPDGKRLEESGVFPPTPLLPEADWNAIKAYYVASAPAEALPQAPHEPAVPDLDLFVPEKLTIPGSVPLTTFARIDAGRREILLGDAVSGALATFGPDGSSRSRVALGGAVVDLSNDGPRTLATIIGHVFPSDIPDGRVVAVPGPGDATPPRVVLAGLERPVRCVVADLNGDGRPDYLVCSFGNYLGRLAWHERKADGSLEEHVLIDQPGAVQAEVRDVDGDGRPDLLVLMAQGREGLLLFTNRGGGTFSVRPLLQFHPAFGSIHFALADMNGDGIDDVVLSNGDNGEYPSPFKRYHGVRVYLNDGKYNLTEAWFRPVNGAFKAVVRDFDGDGDPDIAVISFFPDYARRVPEGFTYLENRGGMQFAPRTFAGADAGRWIAMDAGDVDGDGDVDLVLGAFSQGPPAIAIPASLKAAWQTNGVNALLLRNTRAKGRP